VQSPPAVSDERALALVTAELQPLAGDGPLPVVALTDQPRSTAYPARPWRPARLAIRRELAVRGLSDALRGEIAHEYAHVLRPDTWRHFGFSLLATELGAVGLVAWLAGVIAPWVDHAHALLWLGFWFAGMVLICAGLCCHAWISHRRELRADALAAELLGDTAPVLAMLDDCQTRHERLGRMARLTALLTHPSPSRRQRELIGSSAERRSTSRAPGGMELA
jgi:Zn-dependent protease with chaperone function